ncbi:tetraacyldisaccharide 4'-kinase [Pelistega sp. NLN82]|uniref:Tetraacyldisaccharide 4'-kinase n=1 Tax=Pelistega ratti TaxID=2652177 RepID=A0A6L9Y4K2_9BURK|nr:tetraacyldisaccharide 4'-kinase [Pelistega ratti]NEN75402.1 tetraacyldisaccharide 4'-kinase [Pelistega ratti]
MRLFKTIKTTLHHSIQAQWLKKGLFSFLLSPLSGISYCYTQKKRQHYLTKPNLAFHAPVPVIVVGNIFVGGTGKTPLTIALVKALQQRGYSPGIISRGYGVKIGKYAKSAFQQNAYPHEIGDEPSLLAQYAPIAVHPIRSKAVEQLLLDYPTTNVIISDDGLQHYALARDIEIIVQDQRGTGNGQLLPAGPLRESASRLQTVDFVITNYNTKAQADQAYLTNTNSTKSNTSSSSEKTQHIGMYLSIQTFEHIVSGKHYSVSSFLRNFSHQTFYAIAGIGHPQRFYQSLNNMGITLKATRDFDDHYAFQAEDLAPFTTGIVLMTSKDAIKCRHFAQDNWWAVHVDAQFTNPEFFDEIYHKVSHLPLYSTYTE